ncbi:uncharacterized protein LOC115217421 [Argonauta hians]
MFHLHVYSRIPCGYLFTSCVTRSLNSPSITSAGTYQRLRTLSPSCSLLSETFTRHRSNPSACFNASSANSSRTFRTTPAMALGFKQLVGGNSLSTVLSWYRFSSSNCMVRSMSHWRLGGYLGLSSCKTKHSSYCCTPKYIPRLPSITQTINTQSKIFISSNTERDQRYNLPKDLKEDIQTIPNLLTCCRMGSAPLLSYLVVQGFYPWALGLFICAGITDLLDGYIARNFANQKSMLGTYLDPLADKVLVSFLAVSLAAADLLPVPLLLIIIGRDIGLIGVCFYIRYISLPQPRTVKRYFDLTYATAQLHPTLLSKVNTGIQLTLLAVSLAAPVMGFVDHLYLQALWYLTATTTILSGCGYILARKNVVKFLDEELATQVKK